MIHYFYSILKYPFLDGKFLPFKIYHFPSGIKIRSGAVIQLLSRLTLGCPDKSMPVVSRLPINLYFGKNSKSKIGSSVSVGPGVNIIVKDNAKLSIGDNTYFTSDMHIEVVNELSIGKDCAISWGVTIIDDDHHQLISNSKGNSVEKNSVEIGNKVWIGCNATILKNTVIGNNCIIAANSLVKGTFPDNCLIGGVPAKILKENIDWK